MRPMFGSTPKMESGSDSVPMSFPFMLYSVISGIGRLLNQFQLLNPQKAAIRAGDRAPDEKQVLLGVDLPDGQPAYGGCLSAHAAGLLGAFECAGGIGGAAGLRLAVHHGAVAHVATVEMVA